MKIAGRFFKAMPLYFCKELDIVIYQIKGFIMTVPVSLTPRRIKYFQDYTLFRHLCILATLTML